MKRILWALAVVLLLGSGTGWWALTASLPAGDHHTLSGLVAPIDLRYDRWYRPHLQAKNFNDALAAQGWLHARHRLWQMEMLRRAGRGRLAEVLGAGALDTDRQLWRFGVPQLGQRFTDAATADARAQIAAYVSGVNDAIESYRVLPPEFLLLQFKPTPWTVEDVYSLSALLAFQSAGNAPQELLRLALAQRLPAAQAALFDADPSALPGYPFILPGSPARGVHTDAGKPPAAGVLAFDASNLGAVVDPVDPQLRPQMPRLALGSNSWAVAPARSASGKALFAFDSHDTLGLPNLFYEVHMTIGERELHGWSVPGLPGVINGYNESIAWGLTNIGDSQDLYIESRGEQPDSFVEDGASYPARVERVTVPVRGREDEVFTILHSRNGPLIHDDPPISLAWTALKAPSPRGDALLALNQAQSWEDFNACLDGHVAPVLNAIYADRDGNIGFRTLGRLPLRARGNGQQPLPASAGNRWQGLVPSADMPRLLNPAQGYLAAANARVNAPGSYPLVAADNAPGYRMRRIKSVLSANSHVTLADMQSLQTDWQDTQAALLLPHLLKALPRQPALQQATALLQRWAQNPQATPDSAAALLFQQWYLTLSAALLEPRLGPTLYARLQRHNYMLNAAVDTLVASGQHADWWPDSRSAVLAQSLEKAVAALTARHGPAQGWRLDAAQRIGLRHELGRELPALAGFFDVAAQPWGGSPATVGRASYLYAHPFVVRKAATVRSVGEMGSPPQFRAVIPGGQSGHPLSPHYRDQMPAWLAGELLETTPPAHGETIRLLPAASPGS
ncbi:MAG: penicillin acylase family protein [Halieaceae bacterium]|nr:penicillin acylase family protein [Halieaceae bacterium]